MESPKSYDLLQCRDGTYTLLDRANGQAMHSLIGAAEEALSVYVRQSDLESRLGAFPGPLVVYDVGLGTGANALALIEEILRLRSRGLMREVRLFSFEDAPEGLATALEQESCFPLLSAHREAIAELLRSGEVGIEPNLRWTLLRGDFRERLSDELSPVPPAELVLYDFYAPKIDHELWEAATFRLLRRHCLEGARVVTYCASRAVRDALKDAGFDTRVGAGTSMKRETTVATAVFPESAL